VIYDTRRRIHSWPFSISPLAALYRPGLPLYEHRTHVDIRKFRYAMPLRFAVRMEQTLKLESDELRRTRLIERRQVREINPCSLQSVIQNITIYHIITSDFGSKEKETFRVKVEPIKDEHSQRSQWYMPLLWNGNDVIICFFSFWTEINALFANAHNTYSNIYNMRVEENYDF